MQFFGPRIRHRHWVAALLLLLSASSLKAVEDDLKSLVQRAFDLHQKGQYSAALPLLRQAYRLQPEDYFVNLLLGIDSLRTGEAKAAVAFLKKASRLRPKEEFPLSYLGEAYARQELYGDAAESYIKAAQVAPDSAEASIALVDFALSRFATVSMVLRSSKKGLAEEYRLRALSLGEADPARFSLLQRAADLDPSTPGIWSDLGDAAFAQGDVTSANEYLRRALEADPNDLSAWVLESQLSAQSGDWKRANERLNSVARRSPETLSAQAGRWPKRFQPTPGTVTGATLKFFSCLREGRSSCPITAPAGAGSLDASVLFREQRWDQLTHLPSSQRSGVELQRGIALAKIENCPRAIPSLERGVSGSPDAYGMFLLSWCYSRVAGRVADHVQGAATDDAAPLHVMRGDILLRLQAKAEPAIVEYQQALAKDPDDPSVLERLAEAQLGAGQNEAARASAAAALKLDSQRMGAKRTLAKISLQERDYATALPYLRELAMRNPQDVAGRVELARACAQTGALDDAFQNLAHALEHGYPDEKGSLHYLLGSVLRKMGRSAEAEQAFATAAQLSEAFQHKSYRDQDKDEQP